MAFDRISRRSSNLLSSKLVRLATAALLLMAGGAHALPTEFSARYEVSYSGLTLGEAVVDYRQLGPERYRYSSFTRPLGLASLVVRSEIKEVSEGRITQNGFRPDRYEYDRTGRKAREAELRFDWKQMQVINNTSGEPWKMAIPRDTLDRMASQLQLMYDLANQEEDLTYRIADGGRIKEYTLRTAGRETLQTPYGRLDTVKIVRITDDGQRTTTFWCAPALGYLPIRIDHREKDEDFKMTLQDLAGFSLAHTKRPRSGSETRAEVAVNRPLQP
jgi:hypothetical protein